MFKPDERCALYSEPECWCKRHDCECPFDMRPLSEADKARLLELAERYGWHSR